MKKTNILSHAAGVYYNYLVCANKGRGEVVIADVRYTKFDELVLRLRNKLFSTDSLVLEIDGQIFDIAEHMSFDEANNALSIDALGAQISHFFTPQNTAQSLKDNAEILESDTEFATKNTQIDSTLTLESHTKNTKKPTKNQSQNFPKIALFSDLKFLVLNIQNFFLEHGGALKLPTKMPLTITDSDIPSTLNPSQKSAMRLIFERPLCYIWGAPGSGKTQAVLFNAALAYIRAGKKIAILAPTNLALEQILNTLLAKFDEAGFNKGIVLRLGTPTQSFLSRHPEVCDPSIFEGRRANLFVEKKGFKERVSEAFVVGATLDGFIKRYEMLQGKFAHFFVDECAFAPLIKTLALFVEDAPISLFGDHKQLSPICEMDERELKEAQNRAVNLFNLSSIHVADFFAALKDCGDDLGADFDGNFDDSSAADFAMDSMPGVRESAMDSLLMRPNFAEPNMALLPHAWLNITHRYGQNLAAILERFIYFQGLKGTEDAVEIFVVDTGASHFSAQNDKINLSEVAAIKRLNARLGGSDFAIITPFVAQKNELKKALRSESVYTIHASQGQEWESVVFSPVRLHWHLTDCANLAALFALNVAISRIKKRLFLVCDVAFWLRQPRQLITQLITLGRVVSV